MESIVGKSEIVLRPLEVRLTTDAFYRIYEQIREENAINMENAYDRTIEFCILNGMSLCFSDFISFKRCYYSKIKSRNKKRH